MQLTRILERIRQTRSEKRKRASWISRLSKSAVVVCFAFVFYACQYPYEFNFGAANDDTSQLPALGLPLLLGNAHDDTGGMLSVHNQNKLALPSLSMTMSPAVLDKLGAIAAVCAMHGGGARQLPFFQSFRDMFVFSAGVATYVFVVAVLSS